MPLSLQPAEQAKLAVVHHMELLVLQIYLFSSVSDFYPTRGSPCSSLVHQVVPEVLEVLAQSLPCHSNPVTIHAIWTSTLPPSLLAVCPTESEARTAVEEDYLLRLTCPRRIVVMARCSMEAPVVATAVATVVFLHLVLEVILLQVHCLHQDDGHQAQATVVAKVTTNRHYCPVVVHTGSEVESVLHILLQCEKCHPNSDTADPSSLLHILAQNRCVTHHPLSTRPSRHVTISF